VPTNKRERNVRPAMLKTSSIRSLSGSAVRRGRHLKKRTQFDRRGVRFVKSAAPRGYVAHIPTFTRTCVILNFVGPDRWVSG
jgi:hypothetical protein